jgi:hypothetical protein
VKSHHAALKHGIDPEDIIRAAVRPLWIDDLDEASLRVSFDVGSTGTGACWRPLG